MAIDIRKQRPNYYDDQNFPYGFRRSGLFTILEAEFLLQNGHLMQALSRREIAPQSDEEQEFVNAIESGIHSEQLSVKVWLKYMKAVAEMKSAKIFMSKHSGVQTNGSAFFD